MMSNSELNFLKEIVSEFPSGAVVFEIGTALGGSSTIMSLSNPNIKIYTVDLFSDNGENIESITTQYNKIKENLSTLKNIQVLCGNARTDFTDWNTEIDLYFEDGTHFDPVLFDNLNRWSSFLKENGLLLIHDNNEFHPDVKKNIDRLIMSGNFEFIKTVETLTLLKRKERK